jgi:hypothetical protein
VRLPLYIAALTMTLGCAKSNAPASPDSAVTSTTSTQVGDDDDGTPTQTFETLAPSAEPPGDLDVGEVPLFVSYGFDDNGYSGLEGSGGTGGMTWATDFFRPLTNADGSPARVSFYYTSSYAGVWQSESPTYVKRAWNIALADGHEVGNHTNTHGHGSAYTAEQWDDELSTCNALLTLPFDPDEVDFSPDDTKGIGASPDQLLGFRTPFLEYNDALFEVILSQGLTYDCSIEDGWQPEQDGTNYFWPYTLDGGSPGHDVLVSWGLKEPITAHPGLWELPVHPVIVPPDDKAAEYGIAPGLRDRLHADVDWFDVGSGKITGFDYNLWVLFNMSKDEVLATLKYTLDLRLEGNRAPFMFGAHTDTYSDKYQAGLASTASERQECLEEFITYALSKPEVRVAPMSDILDWVQHPTPLP